MFKECCSTVFSLNSLQGNENFLAWCTNTDRSIIQWKDLGINHNSSLLLKPSPNFRTLSKSV